MRSSLRQPPFQFFGRAPQDAQGPSGLGKAACGIPLFRLLPGDVVPGGHDRQSVVPVKPPQRAPTPAEPSDARHAATSVNEQYWSTGHPVQTASAPLSDTSASASAHSAANCVAAFACRISPLRTRLCGRRGKLE